MNSIKIVFGDIYKTLKIAYVWYTISIFEIKARYRRTVIGPFWLTLGTAATIFGMGLVWGSIFNVPLSLFLPYIAVGVVIWLFMSSVMLESCNVFTSQSTIVHNIKMPLLFYIFMLLSRNVIILLHNIVVIVLVFIICIYPISWTMFLFIPGFILIFLNLFWISVVIGFFSTRYRDITPIIGSMLTLLMMVTPIMWKQDMLHGIRVYIARLNPFFHLIDIVRAPLLGEIPSFISYICVITMAIVGLIFSLSLYAKYRHRIAFWL